MWGQATNGGDFWIRTKIAEASDLQSDGVDQHPYNPLGSCGRLRTYSAIKRWINSPLGLPIPLHKKQTAWKSFLAVYVIHVKCI